VDGIFCSLILEIRQIHPKFIAACFASQRKPRVGLTRVPVARMRRRRNLELDDPADEEEGAIEITTVQMPADRVSAKEKGQ
jgi:hypothetical protein